MKNATAEVCGRKIVAAHKLRRACRSIIFRRNSFAPSGNIFSSTSLSMPTPPYSELTITRNFMARLADSRRCIRALCLTFLRNSSSASTTFTLIHPSPTVFSPPLRADIMLTSLRPSIFRAARRSLVDLRALFVLSFSLPISLTLSLVNAYATRSCISRDETPSDCQNVTNPLLPRELGRKGYRNDGTRFRPFRRELSSSEPISVDNLFLSGLQSTRVPHEWDFG